MSRSTEIVDDVYEISVREDPDRGVKYRAYLFDVDVPTLVDTGFEDTTDNLIEGIEETDLEPERLVITHGDHDHIGGYDVVVDRYDPETWVSEQTLEVEGVDVDPDNTFSEGDSVGNFTAVFIPGHEPDTYALIDENFGIAVMGDILVGSDIRGLPAGYFHLPANWEDFKMTKDIDQAIDNLPKLLGYEFEVGLVFHGSNVYENATEKLQNYLTP